MEFELVFTKVVTSVALQGETSGRSSRKDLFQEPARKITTSIPVWGIEYSSQSVRLDYDTPLTRQMAAYRGPLSTLQQRQR